MDTLPTPGPVLTPPALEPEARTFGMLAHLTSLSGYIGVPFGSLLGPLVIWLIKKDTVPFVDAQGKEALNFNLSVLIYLIASGILAIILIGIPLIVATVALHVVCTIIAAMKANRGEAYRYPLTIRFIK